MSADIELESAKWLNENLVVCTLCESSTFHMSEDCNHCQAPLSISTTVSSSEIATHFIPIIGVGGVGKTTYTAMLLELLRHGSHEIQTKLTRASTRALQRRTLKGLFDRKFPPPTSNDASDWDWVCCEVSRPQLNEPRSKSAFSRFMGGDETVEERDRFNWVCPDVPGHAVEQAINHEDYCPVVIKSVAKANGIIVLVDATRAVGEQVNEHEDALAAKLAAFIGSNAPCAGLNSVLVDVPVAIVFTKVDRCKEASEDPTQFVKRQMPNFFEAVHSNIRHYEFFAASVAGGVARVHDDFYIPFQIQPKGVVEPFAWVIKSHTSDR